MKYFKKILYLAIILFCFSNRVNAGVCEGLWVDSNSHTCTYSSGFSVWQNDVLKRKYDGGYFMRPGYLASNGGNSYMALCLDPGLSAPSTSLVKIRELSSDYNNFSDIVNQYDEGLYKMFQSFYKSLVDNLENDNSITNDHDYMVNKFRSYLENSVRVWTYNPKFGFDYLDKNSAHYEYDALNYKTCASYIDNKLSPVNKITKNYCFGTNDSVAEHNIDMIKGYYNAGYIWKNPLKIEKNLDSVEENGNKYYLYKFDVTFNNGTYSFFDGNYSKGISYRDIQLPSAYFSLNDLTVNGESCKDSGKCADYSAGGVINYENINGVDKKQFIIKLTEQQYLEYKNSSIDGTVNVTMNYSFQHPLNIENLFIGRVDLRNTSQRMLIVKNYVHNDSISFGKEVKTNVCTYETKNDSSGKVQLYNFVDSSGNQITDFGNFLSSCSCPSIDTSQMGTYQMEIYKEKCFKNQAPNYKDYDKVCKQDASYDSVNDNTNYEEFSIGYENLVTNINDYCTETCSEIIDINNLKGKYSTVAGTAFKFSEYPNLIATKNCKVKIDNVKWEKDYYNKLKELVEKYNNWKDRLAASNSESTGKCNPHCCSRNPITGSCTRTCYDTLYTYNYSYDKATITNNTNVDFVNSTGENDGASSCGSSIDWKVNDALSEFRNLSANYTSLTNLKNYLRQCNNRLFGTSEQPTTAKQFYYFSQQLNYYYEQTIYGEDNKLQKMSNNKYGLTNLFSGIDDSQFTFDTSSQDDKTQNTGTQNCDILTETGKNTESITTYTDVNGDTSRKVTYNVKYSPKIHKYINNYTSLIVDEETLKNQEDKKQKEYIYLDYSYDTLVNADARINNNYYYFTKMGDSNNLIFEHYKDSDKNAIIKYCTYQITNDIMSCNDSSANNCSGSQENDPVNPYSNIAFRIVDPKNIDPNGRLGSKGFKNWNNDKGKVVKEAIEESDVFNPNNLEYSFTLDSATIQSIRKYNKNKSYSNVNSEKIDGVNSLLKCDNGTKCLSSFITAASDGNTVLFDKKFALNTNGRITWKVYENKDGKNYIDGKVIKDK